MLKILINFLSNHILRKESLKNNKTVAVYENVVQIEFDLKSIEIKRSKMIDGRYFLNSGLVATRHEP